MAARSRITVLLLIFLLSTEHSFAVNLNELAPLVNKLLSEYRFNGMFSLAVSIPLNQDQNKNQNQNQGANQIIQEVLKSDHADNVKNKINKGEVYIGSRVVAAEVRRLEKGADHAESRVVDNLDQLVNSPQVNNNDLLLFYVYASPCVEKCTSYGHTENILEKINRIRHWKSYAVVFSKIFKPKKGQENTKEERIDALERLAWYQVAGGHIGLENIFRCDRKKTKQNQKQTMQCISCSSNGKVAHKCVSDDPPSATSQSEASASTKMCPQPGRGGSSSERGAQDESEWRSVNRRGGRVRRDISCSVEDVSSPQIGFDSGDGNGKVSRGKGKVSKGKGSKGRRGKGRKGKGRRGKGGKGKGRRGKGGKGKGIRGKGGKGKGSRRGGRSRRRGLDQERIFVTDF
ncbi:uncharacterized protein LOC128437348 [Pleuronectes platessa]|uniref:uncharacterized protein LOC128437348 n=1 Tax=Pleuronectes platessa TaxID=8262 RepID=UPI00232A4795|nr:uncharacterized protein LOC128437348 [Pleuronectes platessa]